MFPFPRPFFAPALPAGKRPKLRSSRRKLERRGIESGDNGGYRARFIRTLGAPMPSTKEGPLAGKASIEHSFAARTRYNFQVPYRFHNRNHGLLAYISSCR
jgi:hypothetical protein